MERLSLPYFFFYRFRQLPVREKRITVSTLFTLLRIALTPFIVVFICKMLWLHACVAFIVAAVSDVVDGTLARLFNEETFLGACLDAIADKLLILSCFCVLAYMHIPLLGIPRWLVVGMIVKEMLQIGGTFFLLCKKRHMTIVPTYLSKATTMMQMIFIVWLLICYFCGFAPVKTYYGAIVGMASAMGATLVQYLAIGWRILWKK